MKYKAELDEVVLWFTAVTRGKPMGRHSFRVQVPRDCVGEDRERFLQHYAGQCVTLIRQGGHTGHGTAIVQGQYA